MSFDDSATPPVLQPLRWEATFTFDVNTPVDSTVAVVANLSSLPLRFFSEADSLNQWGVQYALATPLADLTPEVPLAALPSPQAKLIEVFEPSPLRPNAGYELFYIDNQSTFFVTTVDFRTLSVAVKVDTLPDGSNKSGIIAACEAVKSIGRSDDGHSYVMLQFCRQTHKKHITSGGLRALVATDPTKPFAFRPSDPDVFAYHDHDSQHLIFDSERQLWIASQILLQNYTTPGFDPADPSKQSLKYCDNVGCLFRRVLSTRTSADGYRWSNSSACNSWFDSTTNYCNASGGWNAAGMLVPDPLVDPPEQEIYSVKMFWVGKAGTSNRRLAAHALLYAPAPYTDLGDFYGLLNKTGQVAICNWTAGLAECHGPFMYTERWIGPNAFGSSARTHRTKTQITNGDPTHLSDWHRPFRRQTDLGPIDNSLTIGPVVWSNSSNSSGGKVDAENYLVWPMLQSPVPTIEQRFGSKSAHHIRLMGLPSGRLSGLYAPANAEFTTASFAWPALPAKGLTLNADIRWYRPPPQLTCNQGCQAYVMVALLDAATGTQIPGYERRNCVLYDVDGQALPLIWKTNSTGTVMPPRPPGALVSLRISWRSAVVYGVEAS
jgi:hypothetical protein